MSSGSAAQVFAVTLAVTGLGLVGATVAESGVFGRHPEPLPETVGLPENAAPRVAEAEPEVVVPPGVPEWPDEVPEGTGDGSSDPGAAAADTDGSGAPGVGGVAIAAGPDGDAMAPASPAEGSGTVTEAWEPTRRATDRGGCLLTANRATMATAVERREPRGTEGPFTANGEPIYAYLDAANGTGVEQSLTFRWRQKDTGSTYFDEATVGPSSRFRTWADRALPLDQLGPWVVQLLDADRCLIAQMEFDLVAPTW